MKLASEIAEFKRGEILTAERLNQLREEANISSVVTGAYSQGRIGNTDKIHVIRHDRTYYQLTGDLEVVQRTPPGGNPTYDEYPSATCKPLLFDNRINDSVVEGIPVDTRVWFPFLPTWAIWPTTDAKVVAWVDRGTGRLMCDMDMHEKLFGLPQSDVVTDDVGNLRVQYWNGSAWDNVIDPVTSAVVDIEARNPWTPTIPTGVRSTIVRLGTGEYIFDGSDCEEVS